MVIYLLIVFGPSGKPEGEGGNGVGHGNGVKGQGGNCGTGNSPRDF